MLINEKYLQKLLSLLDSCEDFRRGCLSASRWITQFKSLISKGLYSPGRLKRAKSWSTALCKILLYFFYLFVSVLHTIRYRMNSKGAGRPAQVVHTLRTSCQRGLPRGFDALNSKPHSLIFTSLSVASSPHSYLFTSATGRIGVHTTPKYGKKPIRYVTLYFRDRLGAASLWHRNCSTTSVPVCEQKSYTVWFSWRRKSYAV